MSLILWSQDIFTKGEISPLMYARVSVTPYYNGLKTAQNVITFPQGAAGKRFGTYYLNTISNITNASQIFFKSMQYLNECIYLIAITPTTITIYLEGTVAIVLSNILYSDNEIRLIRYTVLDDIFRTTTGVLPPQDLQRASDSPNQIANFDIVNNILTLTSSYYTAGQILPVRFSSPGTLFSATPQLLANRTYFLYFLTANTAQIYSSAPEAKAKINAFVILNAGTGNQFAITLNNWSISQTKITNYPTYDFGSVNYSALTFTPSAVSGNNITLTASGNVFTPANVGGTFAGGGSNGGLMRILSYSSPTLVNGATIVPFTSTSPILGSLSVLTEPAWSNARGWPRVCSSFQNRAFFANTDLLPNGLWASITNDYFNFNDSEEDDDSAISWYPTSDDINYIRFIVPYRSLTIHTNSGVYSTPLSVETAITPNNFSLTLQDSTPAELVQPRGIDNQIVILSGNDAHSLLWDGFNNAYQSNIISIANEQLIRDPIDEAAFVDLTRAGSRYMLIVNSDGTLAIYQTLISEEVQGFTPASLHQSYGNAYFRWVTTSFDGRGWFVTERQIASPGSPVSITTYTQFTLGTGVDFALLNTQIFNLLDGNTFDLLDNDFIFLIGIPTPFTFQTTGALPDADPILELNTIYWAVATVNLDFMVYGSQSNAIDGIDPYEFFDSGINVTVTPLDLNTQFFIEELSFDAKVDCAFTYNGSPISTFNNLPSFNAQQIKIQGDGYGFDYEGNNNTIQTIAHGVPQPVSIAQIGFPIPVVIQPLPLSIFLGNTKSSNLLTPKHIRAVDMMFADTIGGTVNDIPIALETFNEVPIGRPPVPVNGIFQYGIMHGWDDFKDIGLTVMHSEPFDIKLIGIFYKVDV